MRVAPDFGIKGAATGVEDAHDLPAHLAEADGVAKRQAGVRLIGVLPNSHFAKAGLKHTSLNNSYLLANLQHIGRNAPKLHIRVRARGDQWNRRHEHGFWGYEGPIGAPGNAGSILNDLHGIEPNSTGHFRGGTRTNNQGVVGGA